MTSHMVELTRDLLRQGYTEASEWGNRHRYTAAQKLWQAFGDVLECEEREGKHGETVIAMVHNPPPILEGE